MFRVGIIAGDAHRNEFQYIPQKATDGWEFRTYLFADGADEAQLKGKLYADMLGTMGTSSSTKPTTTSKKKAGSHCTYDRPMAGWAGRRIYGKILIKPKMRICQKP